MYPDVVLWEALLFLAGGFWAVAWSADRFVDGATSLALRWRISPFAIGVVIIGFGTSLPELSVSTLASGTDHSALSLGNAYGSNIYNIAVILGLMALIRPLRVRRTIRAFAVPVLALSGAVTWFVLLFLEGLPRWAAAGLLALFVWIVPHLSALDRPKAVSETDAAKRGEHPWWTVLMSLAVLLVGSHFVVWGAVDVARTLGVSELAIGLTLVAAGTSLPELATSISALKKHQTDMILGNIVGSNLFNGLFVVGLSGLIRPVENVPHGILIRDLPLMFALTLALAKPRITRARASVMLAAFILYLLSFWLFR